MPDYSLIDQSSALMYIFYPRRDSTSCPENAFDLLAVVALRRRVGDVIAHDIQGRLGGTQTT